MAESADTKVTETTDKPNEATVSTSEETAKTFTQEDVDKIVTTRLARERKQYADYDELREKASKFDEVEKERLTEVERAQKEREEALAEVERLKGESLRSSIREAARDAGLDPLGALDALTGSAKDLLDPSDMAATMEKLLAERPSLKVAESKKPTPQADQGARGTPTGQVTAEELRKMTPQEIVKARAEGRLKNLLG